MPRNDKIVVSSKEDIPHYIDVDPNMDIVGLPLRAAQYIIDNAERPIEVMGLYMIYRTFYQEKKQVPSIPTLMKQLGWGKEKLTSIRNLMKDINLIEDIKIKEKGTGRFLATRTRLRQPGFPTVGKPMCNIINNINTPDSASQKSGCSSCSSCDKEKEKIKPSKKEFPREQDFNGLWSINRNPTNKVEARKAWKSQPVQKHLPPKDALLEAYEADAIANDWDNTDKKHIPHLSTWLRGRRWENHIGEPLNSSGEIHIMQQLKKTDGIENARQLRKEIYEDHANRGGKASKSFVRGYVKWLASPDSPPASSKDSIKDVLIYGMKYWGVYVDTLSKIEPF